MIRFYDYRMPDRTITVTEASRHFADLVNRTYYRGETTVLVRSGEAVAMMVPVGGATVVGGDWLGKWRSMPRLPVDDADDFAACVEKARKNLPTPDSPWD